MNYSPLVPGLAREILAADRIQRVTINASRTGVGKYFGKYLVLRTTLEEFFDQLNSATTPGVFSLLFVLPFRGSFADPHSSMHAEDRRVVRVACVDIRIRRTRSWKATVKYYDNWHNAPGKHRQRPGRSLEEAYGHDFSAEHDLVEQFVMGGLCRLVLEFDKE